MKKDIYPDVRIEIISEGLTKKILESSESPAPAVYGEEQPEGKNLPNVSIKGKNKELQSVLETSNKKPTYTGLVKEAIQELRKAPEEQYGQFEPGRGGKGKAIGQGVIQRFSDLTPAQQETATKLAYERPEDVRDIQSQEASAMAGVGQTKTSKEDIARRLSDPTLQRKVRSDVREGRGFGSDAPDVREIDSKAMIKEAIQELRKDGHDKIAYGTPKPMIGIGVDPSYSHEFQDIGSREIAPRKTVSIAPGTKDEQKFVGERMSQRPDSPQDYKGDAQRLLTEGGFGRGVSEDYQAGGRYSGFAVPVIAAGKVRDKQIASTLTPEQREKGAASIGSGRLEEAMVKEAIQELRKSKKKVSKLSKDNGMASSAALSALAGGVVPTGVADKPSDLPPMDPADAKIVSNINTAIETGGKLDSDTISAVQNNPRFFSSSLKDLFDSGTTEQKIQVGYSTLADSKPPQYQYGNIPVPKVQEATLPTLDESTATPAPSPGTPKDDKGLQNVPIDSSRKEGVSSPPAYEDPNRYKRTGAGPQNVMRDSERAEGTAIDVGRVDASVSGNEGLISPPLPPAPPSEGGINTDNIPASVFTELGKVKDEGFSSTSLSPEILRPKGKDGKTLPEFGSSGYFSAVLQIGESTKDLNEANYGVSDLPEFLSLYAQNEAQFKEADFLRNLGVDQKADLEKADIKNPFRAALKKQAPPMAMTMNRPPNMGVGVQQPVVTGAGTMKNVEKDVAANKPAATPARTKARRTAAGSIEQRKEKAYIARQAQKALIKSGMVWDQINKQWVPMSKG